MIETNCKNCGAPISHLYAYKCEYCGTFLNLENKKENFKDYRDFEISNISAKIRRSFEKCGYEFVFQALASPKNQWFYADGGQYCTFKCTEATPIGFKVDIDIQTYMEAKASTTGVMRFKNLIENSIPPSIRDEPGVLRAVLNTIYDFFYEQNISY